MRLNALSFMLLCGFACTLAASMGCEDSVKFVNSPPSNLTLSASKCYIQTGGAVLLNGTAVDSDGDSLTFSWTATRGTFSPPSGKGTSVAWTAPAEQGPATITMAVTDDVATSYARTTIVVCLPFPALGSGSRTIGTPGDFFILLGENPVPISSVAAVTISPGVTLVVDGGLGGFEVFGTLIARGTPAQRIKMLGNSCVEGSGLWGGLYLEGPVAHGILSNVDLTMSKDGVRVSDAAVLTADSCEIYNNEEMGVGVFLEGSGATIRRCTIWDNGTGIYVQNGEAEIRESSIRYSGMNGIELSFSRETTPVAIESCTVANNGASGIQLGERASPAIHDCSIFFNGENPRETNYGVKLVSYTATDSVHAERNFWGVGYTTAAKIADVIYDRHDNPGLAAAYVGFTPWLDAAPVTSTAGGAATRKESAWARLWR
jgi:hypothetical protein